MNTTHGPRLQGITAKEGIAWLESEEVAWLDTQAYEDYMEAANTLYDFASDNVAFGDADDAEQLILDWVQEALEWARTEW